MSITAANAIIMLAVPGVYAVPQQLQQFSADNVFGNDTVQANEVMMGVDGFLAAGFVFNPMPWTVELMADSPSNAFFDNWYQAMRVAVDTYRANGTVWLKSLNRKFDLQNGALTMYRPMSEAGKVMRPRQFQITWQNISPAVVV